MYKVQALLGPAGPLGPDSDSNAHAISGNGHIAGLAWPETFDPGVGTDPHLVGATWLHGNPDYSLPISSESVFYDINDLGEAVGLQGFDNSPTEVAIVRRQGAVLDLSPKVGQGSLALGINNAELVCGWVWNNPKSFIYDLKTSSVSWISPVAGAQSVGAQSINASGDVAGSTDTYHAFVFSGGAVKVLGPMAFVTKINDVGVICGSVGKAAPQNFVAAVCDTKSANSKIIELPLPAGATGSHGEDINNKGDVVGTFWNANTYDGTQSAYIYSNGVSVDLNTLINEPGWHLTFANGINDLGEICGTGTLYGRQLGFLLTPKDIFHGAVTLPELVGRILGGVAQDGGGWIVIGGIRIPIGPWGPVMEERPGLKRDALIALAMESLASSMSVSATRETLRTSLLEVAHRSLEKLMEQRAQSTQRSALQPSETKPLIKSGKRAESLKRFRFSR
jgi:probable HAF family extracellular repeat protein